ncbi:MAG: nuclear transport factor 2 family protein [Acidobacteria bacterium]|nr:nuclear transport factor 2 family protein [Acidobacteriota bacterium]MBS1812581.1 nuclear transport factor 2 family protein [Acidobacteriota bacterium]
MKHLILTSLFVFAFACTAFAQGNKVEAEIIKLEQQWVDALVKADAAALETLYSDSLTYTHSSGATDTKAIYIANLKAGKTKYESLIREEVKVRVYGNTALHTSKTNIKLISNGQPQAFAVKMLHVYVKEGKNWRMVAHQTTRLP